MPFYRHQEDVYNAVHKGEEAVAKLNEGVSGCLGVGKGGLLTHFTMWQQLVQHSLHCRQTAGMVLKGMRH